MASVVYLTPDAKRVVLLMWNAPRQDKRAASIRGIDLQGSEQVVGLPSIGPRCHELRIDEGAVTWRVFYRIDPDAIVILDVLKKKTQAVPKVTIDNCKRRLADYDRLE